MSFKYRPDIDGLRAVAVLLVIMFHGGLGFSGGYVGVDVFFVISGYLITGLILKEQETGTFSFRNFWSRRIRRILPALTVVVVAVLVAGYVLYLPEDYVKVGQSAFCQQLLLGNFYFWQNTGYFDGPAEQMPLLHTWSLAVEEQFYLLYPFLLVALLQKWRRGIVGITLALTAVASLVLSQIGVQTYPSATLYLLPTRAWELLAGALIWFIPAPTVPRPKLYGLVSAFSLGGILCVGWFYSDSTPFPGATALAPVAATVLLIYVNARHTSLPAKWLSARPLVFVGLISYSLYLWHWPLLAMGRYWLGNELTVGPRLGLVLLSILLAIISWAVVEQPLRRPRKQTTRNWFGPIPCAIVTGVVVCGLAMFVIATKGAAKRLPEQVRVYLAQKDFAWGFYVTQPQHIAKGKVPTIGYGHKSKTNKRIDFLVWGDSHALATAEFLHIWASRNKLRGKLAVRPQTPPALGVFMSRQPAKERIDQRQYNRAVMEYARKHKIQLVILMARWSAYIEGLYDGNPHSLISDEQTQRSCPSDAKRALLRGLTKTISELEQLGSRVFILGQIPELAPGNPKIKIVRSLWRGRPLPRGAKLGQHMRRQRNVLEIFRRTTERAKRASYFDPTPLCFEGKNKSKMADERGCFYRDDDHISTWGANTFMGDFFNGKVLPAAR